jgi:hypothetical protein
MLPHECRVTDWGGLRRRGVGLAGTAAHHLVESVAACS